MWCASGLVILKYTNVPNAPIKHKATTCHIHFCTHFSYPILRSFLSELSMSRSMLVAAARADKSLFFCCESDFKIVSPASSVSVAILCACSNVSDKWSALDTEAIKTSRRSSSFKTANALLLLLLLFLPPPLFDSTSPPEGKSNCWCCLKEARSVYLKEENEQSRSKRERE